MPLCLKTISPMIEKKLFKIETVFCGPISMASSVNPLMSMLSKLTVLTSSTTPRPVRSPWMMFSRTALGTNFWNIRRTPRSCSAIETVSL